MVTVRKNRVSEKHEIEKKTHFVFLRNTHLFQTCVILPV